MKHRFFTGFLFACISTCLVATAQDPNIKEKKAEKPQLFASLPAKLPCNRPELEKISHYKKSDRLTLKLSDNFLLSGEVIEKIETSPGIVNINIRLSNFGNALLNITIEGRPGNETKIIGRIIHPKNADALVIAEENGKYYITKHKMEFFMVE